MSLSFQLNVVADETAHLPPYSDKCILPQSILESITHQFSDKIATGEPLIFRLSSCDAPHSRSLHVGVREFTAPENCIIMPTSILARLQRPLTISIELEFTIAKAKSVKIKPKMFYPNITDYKFFFEATITKFYTLVQLGELTIETGGLRYEFLVEEINGGEVQVASLINTDVVLDVVPLDDTMAQRQLDRSKSMMEREPVTLHKGDRLALQLKPILQSSGEVPLVYKWDRAAGGDVEFQIRNVGGNIEDVFNVDLIVGDQFCGLENWQLSTLDQDSKLQEKSESGEAVGKQLRQPGISKSSKTSKDGDSDSAFVYVTPFAWHSGVEVELIVKDPHETQSNGTAHDAKDTTQARCSNCLKSIPRDKLQLHELHCLRNNVRCPQCNAIFHKCIPAAHWHCEAHPCNSNKVHGNTEFTKFKHQKLYHTPQTCSCRQEFPNFFQLVQHKSSDCAEKLHQCRFCMLILAQGKPSYESVYNNMSQHEFECGNKTVECVKCDQIIRHKDLQKHLQVHQLDKANWNASFVFEKCRNANCVNQNSSENLLGLCSMCYGPLFVSQHDATHLKLQQRLERRYVLQMTKGCGSPWCNNEYCKVNSSFTIQEALGVINSKLLKRVQHPTLPINAKEPPTTGSGKNDFWFCVSQSVAAKNVLYQLLLCEDQYEPKILLKALQQNTDDESKIREWLEEHGVKKRID
ncbi:uncharacterized protein LODBEIA_P61060 [Lodderomyces beijingensis]|uniref:Ubiquitin-protein ligase E3A N-terminal zinc-binding domain-containing protein n=1 Tax=Lodderomyces beijingensis TaxID=1775926 RepID=A0ABP0ZX69_9ASCO